MRFSIFDKISYFINNKRGNPEVVEETDTEINFIKDKEDNSATPIISDDSFRLVSFNTYMNDMVKRGSKLYNPNLLLESISGTGGYDIYTIIRENTPFNLFEDAIKFSYNKIMYHSVADFFRLEDIENVGLGSISESACVSFLDRLYIYSLYVKEKEETTWKDNSLDDLAIDFQVKDGVKKLSINCCKFIYRLSMDTNEKNLSVLMYIRSIEKDITPAYNTHKVFHETKSLDLYGRRYGKLILYTVFQIIRGRCINGEIGDSK